MPSPRQDEVGHHKQLFSELNTQPGCTPVNASPRRLPDGPHHSGPRRLARSYLVRLFHSLPFSGLRRRTVSPFLPPVCFPNVRLSRTSPQAIRNQAGWLPSSSQRAATLLWINSSVAVFTEIVHPVRGRFDATLGIPVEVRSASAA